MNRNFYTSLIVFLISVLSIQVNAQYVMQNAFVTDCEGTMTDSDAGPDDGQYDHEEDFTFTICVEGASAITVMFDFFATEEIYDLFTVYDGPDINSPVITVLDGVITSPPVLVANSGCITFHFVSDDNIVAQGWSLSWEVEIEDIANPDLMIESELECPLGNLELSIDQYIPCEVITPGNFQLIGPDASGISAAIPLDCDADGNATTFNVVFSDSLSLSGSYTLIFEGYIVNSCGDTLTFETLLGFELEDCPFQVEIFLVEDACPGECGQVEVEIYSTDPGPYTFDWSHTAATTQVVDVCTVDPLMISVNVTNTGNGNSAQDDYLYEPRPEPQIANPFMGDTICANSGNHDFVVDLNGGFWNSQIMNNQENDNRYRTWRWSWSDGIQEDFISYQAPNGCFAYDTVYVIPIYAGQDQAVCVQQDELLMTGFNPDDGVWNGPNVSPDGVFTVTTPGVYDVSYTNEEGCVDWKKVHVVNEIVFDDLDTICSNQQIELRNFVNSYGGFWAGPGINHDLLGRLQAWKANINAWNTYYYDIEGCRDSLEIYIQGIWAGPDLNVCSSTESIQLIFAGNWSGPGVYNPIDSTYDISALTPGTYTITGQKSGCQDNMDLTIHDVQVEQVGQDVYCYDAGWIHVNDIVNSSPNNGMYSGEGIIFDSDEFYFDPSLVTGTESFIVFEALGCQDSIMVQVEQALTLDDYSFCEFGSLHNLDNGGNSGYWTGPGILVAETGLINIEELDPGFNEVYFVTDLGCTTPVSIEIVGFVPAEINNTEESYCYQDTSYTIDIAPNDGTFYINGIESLPEFNPSILGPGFHELKYVVGEGECEDRLSVFIVISEPITGFTFANDDQLCPDEPTSIFVENEGGNGVVSAFWDQDLGFGKSHIIRPTETTTYSVTLTDGCSDELELDLEVTVLDSFNVNFNFGPEVCFGDSSFVQLNLAQADNYNIQWNGGTLINELILNELPGSYQVSIEEMTTGCKQDYFVDIPGAAPLGAGFTLVPNQECIDLLENEISVLNQAYGYSGGYMNFGQGGPDQDIDFDDLSDIYNDIGEFTISQVVYNDLGCRDSISRKICVENVVRFFLPNIFSPDGDGVNDILTINSLGIDEFTMSIYDRWGNVMFTSDNVNRSWDGTYHGNLAMSGVYTVVIQYMDQETGQPYMEMFDLTLVR